MASDSKCNGSSDSRFLLPDMFSFSFNPEVLTYFWGLCAKKADDIQQEYKLFIPKTSSLLQVFVPEGDRDSTSFLTFLKYSVVTTGTVLIVGFASYGTYQALQNLRQKGISRIKTVLLNATETIKERANRMGISHRPLEVVLMRGCNNNYGSSIVKRPSDLFLTSNGSPQSSNNRLNGNGNGNGNNYSTNSEGMIITVTPINPELSDGDEEGVGEVQGQYFGPIISYPSKKDEEDEIVPTPSLETSLVLSPMNSSRDATTTSTSNWRDSDTIDESSFTPYLTSSPYGFPRS